MRGFAVQLLPKILNHLYCKTPVIVRYDKSIAKTELENVCFLSAKQTLIMQAPMSANHPKRTLCEVGIAIRNSPFIRCVKKGSDARSPYNVHHQR